MFFIVENELPKEIKKKKKLDLNAYATRCIVL